VLSVELEMWADVFAWSSKIEMTEAKRVSLRERVSPSARGGLAAAAYRRAVDFVAGQLLRQAGELWPAHPLLIQEAIDKVERAWSLTHDPKIAIQLATMYDRANRNDDALVILRQACRENPRHQLLRHHAGITLLRHGSPEDIGAFFDSVMAIDPDDAFACFVTTLRERFDVWTGQIAASVERNREGRRPFLIGLPIWGATYAGYCARFLFASLVSPNNLPALAKDHAVHVAIFTDEETEKVFLADPLFGALRQYATIDFIRYGEHANYRAAMEAGYGEEPVYYSDQSLAFYYTRNCKFALMSCAHYVALAAGRVAGALVSCVVADNIFSDGAFPYMVGAMADADAVMLHSIQMQGHTVRPLVDAMRKPDGSLQLSAQQCTEFVIEHLPPMNFANASRLADPPLRLAWKVGDKGVLIHGNHYHPYCLRPEAFDDPLHLSIDPVDSRFIDRTSVAAARVHLVQGAGAACLSIDDDPSLEPSDGSMGALSVPLFGFWLWGYWGRLRGMLFRSPLRFARTAPDSEWADIERSALEVVDAIVDRAAALDAGRTEGKSWRLKADDV
jgi:tetratricopeptide (TPR) repeat protein